MTEIFFLFIGMFIGLAVPVVAYLFFDYQYNSSPEAKKKKQMMSELKARMDRAKEISNEMSDIASRLDRPQRNALDGKYKNQILARFKALEEEKFEILKSIVKDGFDPELKTTTPDGFVTTMKLSEFLAQNNIFVEKEPPSTSAPTRPKLSVVRNNDDLKKD